MPAQQPESPQMTAPPDSMPHSSAAPLPSLLSLAPWASRLAVVGLVLGLGALLLAATGARLSVLVVAAGATTLLILAGFAVLAARGVGVRQSRGARMLAAGLADDPDPVLVTARDGTPLAANRLGADPGTAAACLSGWCADPQQAIRDMLAEIAQGKPSWREYRRKAKGLRVTAHAARAAGGLVIWRFAPFDSPGAAQGIGLALPLVTTAVDGRVWANPEARTLLEMDGSGDAAETVLQPIAEAATSPFEVVTARLTDGRRVRAMALPDGSGDTMVLLLPDQPLPAIDLRRDDRSARGFEDIPVALVALDSDGRIVRTNRLARVLLGLGDGATPPFWKVVEGLGRPVSDWLDDALAGRAVGRPEVLRATLTPDETFVQIILRRATGAAGEGALVAVISDATELKSLEARFVQSQKMQAIGQLAGGVAHDFNNLLTAISGHCDLLLMNRDRYDPDYNDLLQIHQNANRAAALVRQLLAFSRKQTLKPETFRLETLLEDVTHLLTRLVGERIALDLVHDPDLAPIRADRRQLEQVIMNLVVNARDAMPMGGTIRIVTQALHLDAELEHGRARVPPGDYVTVQVVDEGVGIAPGIIDKIFEPFFTTKRMGEGTGLGLSTAYGIVKQMGGYIFADSVEGSGTTFTLYFASQTGSSVSSTASTTRPPMELPVPDEATASSVTPRPVPRQRAGTPGQDVAAAATEAQKPEDVGHTPANGSILLVEDEAPVRAFAARALRLQGYRVFEAHDGEQALEFLADRSLRIDLFVTDVIMPGIDGPGWVGEALLDRPGTPVVFMSGYTEDTLSAALGRIPRAVFLGKPFSLKDLSETIIRQLAAD